MPRRQRSCTADGQVRKEAAAFTERKEVFDNSKCSSPREHDASRGL